MSSRPTVPGTMRQAGDILRVLARKMPDEILQDYFRELSPAQVRRVLQDAAAVLAPAKKQKTKKKGTGTRKPITTENMEGSPLLNQSSVSL